MPESRRWPLHPPPYPGEALSSWVHRLAQALDTLPVALMQNQIDPLTKPSLGYRLDFDPPEHVLFSLAEGTGQPVDAVRRMTARGYVPSLLNTLETSIAAIRYSLPLYLNESAFLLPSNDHRDWHSYRYRHVLPWYCLQRFWQPHGCPDCLAEAPEPYLRLHWRFAWMVTCPMHHCMLRPFVIHRPAQGTPQVAWARKEMYMHLVSFRLFMLDAVTLQAVTQGSCDLPFGTIPAAVWIRLLRTVLDELGVGVDNAGTFRDQLTELWKSVEKGGPYLREWRPYERLYPKYQQMFMAMAANAFSDAFEQPSMQRRILEMANFHHARACDPPPSLSTACPSTDQINGAWPSYEYRPS